MKYIDLSKYDLKDPNVTCGYICKKEGVCRNTVYHYLRKNGITLRNRGLSDRAKMAMVGRISKRRQKDPFTFYITRIFKQWRANADGRGMSFDLTQEDIVELLKKQNNKCALSGEQLCVYGENKNISLDRINSKLGYTKVNCQLVTIKINYMKQDYGQEDFIKTCTEVSNHCKIKGAI